jgi:Arc/MetJ-type ribon-helix-helix transcriptional regulator
MTQITLRVPDDLLERIENATGPETSRSEYLREAVRDRLDDDLLVDDLRDDLDDLEARVDRLEEQQRQSLIDRLLG